MQTYLPHFRFLLPSFLTEELLSCWVSSYGISTLDLFYHRLLQSHVQRFFKQSTRSNSNFMFPRKTELPSYGMGHLASVSWILHLLSRFERKFESGIPGQSKLLTLSPLSLSPPPLPPPLCAPTHLLEHHQSSLGLGDSLTGRVVLCLSLFILNVFYKHFQLSPGSSVWIYPMSFNGLEKTCSFDSEASRGLYPTSRNESAHRRNWPCCCRDSGGIRDSEDR